MQSKLHKACGLSAILIAFALAFVTFTPTASCADKPSAKPGEFIRVEVQGKLQTGIMAIGGETTGTIITANGVTWELDLGRDKDLHKKAELLNGKRVLVRGELTRKRGVEIKFRWIVKVSSLEASPDQAPPKK